MISPQAKQARKQVDSEMLERTDDSKALALERRSLRGGQLLGEERNRAFDSCGVALKQDCADGDFRRICIQRERRFEIRVSEARLGTQAALELSESLDVFASEVHWLGALARSSQIIQRGSQRGLFVYEVRVDVNEAEELL